MNWKGETVCSISRHCHQLSAHLGKLGSTSDHWCCPELPYFLQT